MTIARHGDVSATISATATVAQPIGLVDIQPTTTSPTPSLLSSTTRPFALLAPKLSGVIISVDGITIDRTNVDWADTRRQSSIGILSLPLPATPAPTIITLIYSEN